MVAKGKENGVDKGDSLKINMMGDKILGETKPIPILDFLIECREDKFFTK